MTNVFAMLLVLLRWHIRKSQLKICTKFTDVRPSHKSTTMCKWCFIMGSGNSFFFTQVVLMSKKLVLYVLLWLMSVLCSLALNSRMRRKWKVFQLTPRAHITIQHKLLWWNWARIKWKIYLLEQSCPFVSFAIFLCFVTRLCLPAAQKTLSVHLY